MFFFFKDKVFVSEKHIKQDVKLISNSLKVPIVYVNVTIVWVFLAFAMCSTTRYEASVALRFILKPLKMPLSLKNFWSLFVARVACYH